MKRTLAATRVGQPRLGLPIQHEKANPAVSLNRHEGSWHATNLKSALPGVFRIADIVQHPGRTRHSANKTGLVCDKSDESRQMPSQHLSAQVCFLPLQAIGRSTVRTIA